jgi:uncharacterized protein
MVVMEYEWDPKKAELNFRKHGVLFADAVTVFSDDQGLTMEDAHPDEERFLTMGMDAMGRLLVVSYTWRGKERIRIISARKAIQFEEEQYAR